MRFMLSRRWALFALTVVVLAYGAYLLGQWQFHRLAERESGNAQTRTNLKAEPAPVADVLAVGEPSAKRNEWRRVTATGTYLPDESVIVRYQTRDGGSGVDVVVPLRTEEGPALLVDRGWVKTGNVGVDRLDDLDLPAPPSGQVTVTGFVRADATGDAATVTDGSTRAVSSREIGPTLDEPVYGGFVDVDTETPAPVTPLAHAELPDLGNGPHFFYGLQWWFFGVLAVFGFFFLAYDERKKLLRGEPVGRQRRKAEPPTGRTDGDAPEVTAPASSRRPPAASRR